jgi:hypothetical protein
MSLAARLAKLERETIVDRGTMELHFTEAGDADRQIAMPCYDPAHGPRCAYTAQPNSYPGKFIRVYEGVWLPE